jgi:hypothetical protein
MLQRYEKFTGKRIVKFRLPVADNVSLFAKKSHAKIYRQFNINALNRYKSV